MSIAQGRTYGLNLSREGPRKICPNVNRLEDTGILRINVADLIIAGVIYISLILLNLTHINL
jgi:hypothetical protein